jgi:hypothetical protein
LIHVSLEAKRQLFKSVGCFARFTDERAISNETAGAGNYTGTSGAAGLCLDF